MMKVLFLQIALLLQVTITSCQTHVTDFPVLRGPYLGQKTPEMKPELFAPGIVSSGMFNHSSITISPDGKYIFFLKMGGGHDDIYWASAKNIEKIRPKS